MLTENDIKKLKNIFAIKDEFKSEFSLLRDELSLFREDYLILLNSVDSMAKTLSRHDSELIITNHRLHKLENPA